MQERVVLPPPSDASQDQPHIIFHSPPASPPSLEEGEIVDLVHDYQSADKENIDPASVLQSTRTSLASPAAEAASDDHPLRAASPEGFDDFEIRDRVPRKYSNKYFHKLDQKRRHREARIKREPRRSHRRLRSPRPPLRAPPSSPQSSSADCTGSSNGSSHSGSGSDDEKASFSLPLKPKSCRPRKSKKVRFNLPTLSSEDQPRSTSILRQRLESHRNNMAQVFSEAIIPTDAALASQIISKPLVDSDKAAYNNSNSVDKTASGPQHQEEQKQQPELELRPHQPAEELSREDLLGLFRRTLSMRSRNYCEFP